MSLSLVNYLCTSAWIFQANSILAVKSAASDAHTGSFDNRGCVCIYVFNVLPTPLYKHDLFSGEPGLLLGSKSH